MNDVRSSVFRSASTPIIVFTHVPKTSGTSFRRTLVEPNIACDQMYAYSGFRRFLLDRGFEQSFIWGHVPLGLHSFTGRDVRYITFLRDPVDRAVSHYYFVKDSDPAIYRHPSRAEADALSLTEFFELRKYQNLQTRFLAGLQYHYLYPRLSSERMDRAALRKAIANLTWRYFCFGLQEHFDESLDLFQRRFGWQKRVEVSQQKRTERRPTLADLDQATLLSLQETNRLDCELYAIALEAFEANRRTT